MIDTSNKKKTLLALFLSTALAMTGCGETPTTPPETKPAAAQTDTGSKETSDMDTASLTDDAGNDYTVTTNEDGTSTATYANNDSVTFSENEDGTLAYHNGNSSLLPLLAAGYLLRSGQRYQQQAMPGYAGTYTRQSPTSGDAVSSNNTASKSASTANSHSGFGSAGARSGTS